jgi:hypothetical protein
MNLQVQYFLLLAFSLSICSCSFFDDQAPEPMFLDLKNPTVSYPSSGKETHNITDVWVFQDDQSIGVFPLPAKVPVFTDKDSARIKILAGIRVNGMVDVQNVYAFYDDITVPLRYEPKKTIDVPLDFKSVPNAKLPIDENFESVHTLNVDLDKNFDSKIEIDTTTASLGKRCGVVNLSNAASFVEVASSREILPSEVIGIRSYLEFDYRGEGEIAVGVAKVKGAVFKSDYVLFVPGKANWNRIYVDLQDILQAKDYDSYRILISFSKAKNAVSSKLYIDNVKHVHF